MVQRKEKYGYSVMEGSLLRGLTPLPYFWNIMDTIPITDIVNAILGLCRDLIVYLAPLIGILGGLKFVADWVHKIIFGKKV